MNLVDIKNKLDLEQQKKRWWYFALLIIGFFLFLFLMNNVNADYVISAADGNVNVHFDTNAVPSTQSLNLNIDQNIITAVTDQATKTNSVYLLILFTIMCLFYVIPKFQYIGGLAMIGLGLLVLVYLDINSLISYIYIGIGVVSIVYDMANFGKGKGKRR